MNTSGWTLQEKVELVSRLAGDGRLSDAQFRVAVVLILYFHNTTSGQCFPSYQQLSAAACVSKRASQRATQMLREMGVIAFEQSSGGRCRRNSYKLLKGDTSAPFSNEKGCHQRTRPVTPAHPLGGDTSAPAYTQRIYHRKKSEALPSPPNEASASQKVNGLHEKGNGATSPPNPEGRIFWEDKKAKYSDELAAVMGGKKGRSVALIKSDIARVLQHLSEL